MLSSLSLTTQSTSIHTVLEGRVITDYDLICSVAISLHDSAFT